MKKIIASSTSFTTTERMGIVALAILLFTLIGIRVTMQLWVHPVINKNEEKKFIAAWEVYKRAQPIVKKVPRQAVASHQDASDENGIPLPDKININTADSATLVRLRGIGPVTAAKIVERRRKKGPYTNVNQLREVGVFNNADFVILKKHLTLK